MHVALEYHAAQAAYRAIVDRFDGWGETESRAITALAKRLQAEAAHGQRLPELGQAAEYWPVTELADWLTGEVAAAA